MFKIDMAIIIPIVVARVKSDACIHRPQAMDKYPFVASSMEFIKGNPGTKSKTEADKTMLGVELRFNDEAKFAITVAKKAVIPKVRIKTNLFFASSCLIIMAIEAAKNVIKKPFKSTPLKYANEAHDKPTINTNSHLL